MFALFWRGCPCRYRKKVEEEDAFLLEDDPECQVLSDKQIISQILAVSQP